MIIDIKRFNEEIEKKCEELFTPYEELIKILKGLENIKRYLTMY